METDKQYLTPNEVAELLMVSPVTVRQWAQKGMLKAYTTPGGHRRFLPEDIEDFCKERKVNKIQRTGETTRMLIIDNDRQVLDQLQQVVGNNNSQVEIESANDGFLAGQKVEAFKPHVVLLNLESPNCDGFSICKQLKQSPRTEKIRVIAMSESFAPETVERVKADGADTCIKKPLESAELLTSIGINPVN